MKKLFLLPLAAMLMLVGCGQGGNGGGSTPAANTVTFNAAEFTDAPTESGKFSASSLEKNGITAAFTKVNLAEWAKVKDDESTKTKELRVNKGSDGSSTLTLSGKTVTKVEFVCQLDNGSSQYGPDGFAVEVGTLGANVVGELEQTATWEGESANLVFSAKNHQVRVYSFVVTYK